MSEQQYIKWFESLGMNDVESVGGKDASLGEMISHLSSVGVKVPNGFATTADAYRLFLQDNQLEQKIRAKAAQLDLSKRIKIQEVSS